MQVVHLLTSSCAGWIHIRRMLLAFFIFDFFPTLYIAVTWDKSKSLYKLIAWINLSILSSIQRKWSSIELLLSDHMFLEVKLVVKFEGTFTECTAFPVSDGVHLPCNLVMVWMMHIKYSVSVTQKKPLHSGFLKALFYLSI